jgi:hypothetical protein
MIVALWAVPRSVSTTFEKSFSRRSDARVVHEPFTDCYYFSSGRRSARYGYQPRKTGITGNVAVQNILAHPAPLIFVKDLAFQAEPYVSDEFLRQTFNTFMIRHPKSVLRSLSPLKPDFTEDEFGFTALARLFARCTDNLSRPPVVVDGSDLRRAPREVLDCYCRAIAVPFQEPMLHWPDGRIKTWSPEEELSQARWHSKLESSHTILPEDIESDCPPEIPPELREIYDRALEIYDSMTRFSVLDAQNSVIR